MVAPNRRTAKRADQIPWPCGQQAAGADRSSLFAAQVFPRGISAVIELARRVVAPHRADLEVSIKRRPLGRGGSGLREQRCLQRLDLDQGGRAGIIQLEDDRGHVGSTRTGVLKLTAEISQTPEAKCSRGGNQLVGHALKPLSGLLRRDIIPKHLRQSIQQLQHPILTDNLQKILVGCMIETTELGRCIGCCVRLDTTILSAAFHETRVGDRFRSGRGALSGLIGVPFGLVSCISSPG